MNPQTHSDCIETFTGKYIRPTDPDPDSLDVLDIAHALSNQCRYNGHCRKFYSVAEHCVLMALHFLNEGDPELAYDALLHDAAEAYLPDVCRPLKQHVPDLMEIEDNLNYALAERFEFRYPFLNEVKLIDHAICLAEAKLLMPSKGHNWTERDVADFDMTIDCLTPDRAEEAYLAMYNTLFNILFIEENVQAMAE